MSPNSNAQTRLSFKNECSRGDNFSISFVGDILAHHSLTQYALNHKDSGGYCLIMGESKKCFQAVDLATGNFEGTSTPHTAYSQRNMTFNFPPLLIANLEEAGIGLVSLANNHSMDTRTEGAVNTLKEFSKSSISTTGTESPLAEGSSFFRVMKKNGVNVAFISCTEKTNGIPDPNGMVFKMR